MVIALDHLAAFIPAVDAKFGTPILQRGKDFQSPLCHSLPYGFDTGLALLAGTSISPILPYPR
jgi:hypothetical protein